MSGGRILVQGLGVVSPAGWGVAAMRVALAAGVPLPAQPVTHAVWRRAPRHRPVPPPPQRPAWLAHPRLRRASPISHHAMAATAEALGLGLDPAARGGRRLGVIVCVMAGPVNYSRRFYDETLANPATASPLVFPETVFNAPASHLAAVLGTTAVNYTLVGDAGTFLPALALAANWLRAGRVDQCLVAGAEEADWLTAGAAALFARDLVVGAGAGALLLGTDPAFGALAELDAVGDGFPHAGRDPVTAARLAREQIVDAGAGADHLLCDSRRGVARLDAAEAAAWADWRGARLSPLEILGEGFAAGPAWQCVAAVDHLARGDGAWATVSVAGTGGQAAAARWRAVTGAD